MNDDLVPAEEEHFSSDDDLGTVLKVPSHKDWSKPRNDDERPATPELTWVGKTKLTQADFEGQAYEVLKAFYPDVIHLQIDISSPLPLSGPPGHVTIQTQFFFNKDLDFLLYGSKGSGSALSISKMKAARYPDFGLELLVPEHMWICWDSRFDETK
ncbi:hypothetical protein Tco_0226578 [Tanacetum coccineum]